MKTISTIKQKKGTTIIELLLALAILIVILASITSLFFYNVDIFQKSDNLSRVQSEVRMASDFLTMELRNVNSVGITADAALTMSVDAATLSAKYPFVRSISFELKSQASYYLVSYIIEGSDSNLENPYRLETEVLLNNVTSAVLGTSTTLYYQK